MFSLKQYWKLHISLDINGWYFWQEIYSEGNIKTTTSLLFNKEKISTLVTLHNNLGCSCCSSSQIFRWCRAFQIGVRSCWQPEGLCSRLTSLSEEQPHMWPYKGFSWAAQRSYCKGITDALYPPGYLTFSGQRVALKMPPVLLLFPSSLNCTYYLPGTQSTNSKHHL